MKVSNLTYDTLKFIALLIAPIAVLIGSIGTAVGYDVSVITAILAAVDVFVGSLVKILADNYNPEDDNGEG